ncbi:MAG: hypothetical protein KIS79_13325 [Burkholderiales bacterium]|nr:hypothetical protein [Burkholderiales bacterium]
MRAPLLLACALNLVPLHATAGGYQIIEGRYRVEIAPGTYQDQLVVRCQDGRTLTVPWETRLREACSESSTASPAADVSAPPSIARPAASPSPRVPDFTGSIEVQKRMLLTRLRAQSGDVPEHLVAFEPGPAGLTIRLLPPLGEVLRRYEACRKARGADCAAARDTALRRLHAAGQTSIATAAPAALADPIPANSIR